MRKLYIVRCLLILMMVVAGIRGWGQVNGDYRSLTAGTWNSAGTGTSTWERFTTTWASSPDPASNTANNVYITKPITGSGSISPSNIIIDNGGTFTITSASTIATSLLVLSGGILQIDAALTVGGSFTVNSGGKVNINNSTTSGVSALWGGTENFKDGSTVEIQNWDYSASGNGKRLIQTASVISSNSDGYYFGNLIISGAPSALFVMSAGSQTINLCKNDFTVALTGGNNVAFTNAASFVTIGGNVTVSSGILSFAATTTGFPITTVYGNLLSTGGTIDLNQNNSGSATSTIDLKGNLSVLSSSTLKSTDAGCKISFSGTAIQTLSVASALSTNVAFEIAAGATVRLINQNLGLINASNKFDVLAGGIFEFNGFDITGLGDFTLAATGTLKITSANGVNATSNNTGNVQNTGTRTFSQSGYYHYVGSTTPQSTGTAMTSGSAGKQIVIQKTNATDIVNVSQLTGTTDHLTVLNGTLVESATAYIYGSGALNMSGGTYKIAITATTVPQLTGTYALSGGTIELNGAGNQVLLGGKSYRNLTFSNTGTKTVTSAPNSITGTITVANSAILDVGVNTMGGTGTNLTMTETSRYITAGTGSKPDAVGTYNLASGTTIEFNNMISGQQNLRLTPNSGIVTYSNIVVSGSSVGTNATSTGISFLAGGSFTVNNGATFRLINTTGFTGSTTTSLNTSTNPTIALAAGSTIEYNAASGTQTVTGSTAYDYSNLTLSAASLKTMAGTPSVAGNFVISGGAVTAPSTITFNGASGIQSIAGLDYNNVNLTNGSTKQLTSDASISFSSVITPAAGTLDLNNKIITLKAGTGANYPKTATVSQVGAAVSYGPSGAFLIERYIPAKRSFRFMTPEVNTTGTARDNWQEAGSLAGGYGTFITGGAVSNGFDQSITNNPSLFMWDVSTQHYTAVGNTNTGVLNAGNAWRLFVRGDRTIDIYQPDNNPTATPTILRTKGKLLTGTATFNSGISSLPSTLPQLSTIDTGYTFIGNPYASLVDWNNMINVDLVTKKSTFPAVNISPTYHTWDPNFNVRGIYVAYNAITGTAPITSAVSRVLQPGQAIFIQNDGPGSSLQFQEAFKKSTGFSTVFRTSADTTRMAVNLLLNNNGGFQDFADGVLQVFNDSFPTSIGNEDSRKFANQDENLAINENGTLLSIEGRPRVALNDTVLLSIWQYRQTDYFLQFEAQNFATGIDAYLKDSYLQTETRISLTDTTLVSFSLTADSASVASNRFMIVFRPSKSLPVTVTNLKGYEKDKGIQLDWISHAEVNIEKYVIEKSLNGHDFNKAGLVKAKGNNSLNETYGWFDSDAQPGPNFYRIGIIDKAGSIQYTPVVKVTIARAAPGISVYPNPAVDNTIGLQVTNMEKGRYAVDLFNGLGQKMFSGFVDHPGGSAYYPVKTGRIMGKGAYRVSIKNGETTINATLIF